jgi:hypothetical protein
VFFILPVFSALTVTIGEALGIGAGLMGIGAGIKGSADYKKAKTIQEEACKSYLDMVEQIREKTRSVQNRLEEFAALKLRTYTGIIREAVEILSSFKSIDLSAFRDMQIEHISFLADDPDALKRPAVKASDVLSCVSIGLTTAVNDRIPYKNTPPILKGPGVCAIKLPSELPALPYAALTMAGLSWGISGSAAKIQAENNALHAARAVKRMERTLAGFDALLERIGEGEELIETLAGKLREVLSVLPDTPENSETLASVETAITLTRTLKQIIETDICTGNGLLNGESGVLFQKIRKEYAHV